MRSRPRWDALKVIGLGRLFRGGGVRASTRCQRRDRAYMRAANIKIGNKMPKIRM